MIFGMVEDVDTIYYFTENPVRGLCVGRNMAILFFWFDPGSGLPVLKLYFFLKKNRLITLKPRIFSCNVFFN